MSPVVALFYRSGHEFFSQVLQSGPVPTRGRVDAVRAIVTLMHELSQSSDLSPTISRHSFLRYLFGLQIKKDLSEGLLVCNENTAALMASYIIQGLSEVVFDFVDHWSLQPRSVISTPTSTSITVMCLGSSWSRTKTRSSSGGSWRTIKSICKRELCHSTMQA